MNQEGRFTVLIVDDDEELVAVLKDHFKERNCEAVVTIDPRLVVEKLANFSVKLMLLDLKMTGLSGFEVLDKISETGLQLPPTIIITGHFSKYQDMLTKYHISVDDVVEKPLTFDVLMERINKKLGEQMLPEEVGSEYESKIYENNRCQIGFVEDESDLVKDLTEFFSERKYKVSCFKNGVVALESLKKNSVDILFVDIKLPGMQGDQLIEELSKLPSPPYMIPMSADPLPEGMQDRLKELKCGDFLEKPFDLIQLIELVKTIAIRKGLLG